MTRRASVLLAAAASLAACSSLPDYEAQSPRSAYADFLVGHVADLKDDHAAAADRYFSALEHAPATPQLIEGALSAALSSGDPDRARRAARIAAQQDVDAADARLVRAADLMRQGRYAAARAELDAMDGDGLQELSARFIAAWSLLGEGDETQALAAFAGLEAPRPFNGLFELQRALMYDAAGADDRAARAYAAARAAEVWIPPAAVHEVAVLARLGRASDAEALFRDSYGRIRDPDIARAVAAAQRGERVERAALTPARGAAIGLYGLAALLVDERESARALPLITLALMLDPELDVAHVLFADAQRTIGQRDAARDALARVPANSPYAEAARAQTAWILRQQGRLDEAIAMAEAAARNGGRVSRTTLGDLYRAARRWEDAEAVYDAILDGIAEPRAADWVVFFSRAAARDMQGDWDGAEADLRRALELSPDQPETLNYLGYSWVDRGLHLQEGLALIERALAQRPQSAAIIDSLGWAHYRLGDYEEALGHLERAVELQPADATLNDHLGDVLWRLGRRTEARFQWSRALALSEDGEAEARAALERKLAEGLPDTPPAANATR